MPDRRAPVVTHMLWYKVGAADEPPGKSGIAHFLEHLMFKGTAKNPAGRFSQVVAPIGGQENAFTANDYTGYYQRVSREHLKTLMEFEADRMTGLVLTDEAVSPELKVVLEEQNQRVANNPRAQLVEQVEAALYLNHPYGKPVIGWRHEIEQLNREDAIAFYKRFYTPNNAVLVVAGDVTAEEVKTLAQATYGKVEPRRQDRAAPASAGAAAGGAAPRHAGRSARPAAESCSATISRLRPPRRGPAKPRRSMCSPSSSAAATTAGSIASWWSDNATVAVGAGAWYNSTALDATHFNVYGSPKPNVTLPQLEAGDRCGDRRPDRQQASPPTKLERAKYRLIADAIYAQDSQQTMARWYGTALTTGLAVDQVTNWPDRIRAVTADAVNAAAKTWLDKRRSVTGYLIKEHDRQRGQTFVIARCTHAPGSALRHGLPRQRNPRAQPRSSALSRRAASRLGWFASRRCHWSRSISPSSAAPTRIRPTSPASATWRPRCSTTARASSTPRHSKSRSKATPSSSTSQSAATTCTARSACCAIARSRASICCGSRSTSRASTPTRSSAGAPRSWHRCGARPPSRTASPARPGGRPPLPTIPTASRRTARSKPSPPSRWST